MGVDIKLPIGLMFAILGIILTGYGLITGGDAEVYRKSLGMNVNLWTGLLMLVFGSVMLVLSKMSKKS